MLIKKQIGDVQMQNITQELLSEFYTHKQKVEEISLALFNKAREVWQWEKDNLGITTAHTDYMLKIENTDCIEINNEKPYGPSIIINENYKLNEKDTIAFSVYDTWAYGGYDEATLRIPLYKLLSDNWREEHLKSHKEQLEQKQKEQEKLKQIAKIEKEKAERAEYERLKTKYEK